jgi:hypothetical protein
MATGSSISRLGRRTAALPLGMVLALVFASCGGQAPVGQQASGRASSGSAAAVSLAGQPTEDPCGSFAKIATAAAAAAGRPWAWSPTPTNGTTAGNHDGELFLCQGFLHAPGSAVEPEADNALVVSVTVYPASNRANKSCPPSGHLSALTHLADLEAQTKGPVIACGDETAHSLLAQDFSWTAGIGAGGTTTAQQGADFLDDQTKQQMVVDWLLAIHFDGRSIPKSRKLAAVQPAGHLTNEDANRFLASDPCRLVPQAVVEHALGVRVAPNPENLGCDYVGNEGTLTLNTVMGFQKRTAASEQYLRERVAEPGARPLQVGELGILAPPHLGVANTKELVFADARFLVVIEVQYDPRSSRFGRDPRADDALLLRFGHSVEDALSR